MVAFGQSLGAAKAIQQQKREQNPVQMVGLLDEIKPLIKRSLSSVGLLDEARDAEQFIQSLFHDKSSVTPVLQDTEFMEALSE